MSVFEKLGRGAPENPTSQLGFRSHKSTPLCQLLQNRLELLSNATCLCLPHILLLSLGWCEQIHSHFQFPSLCLLASNNFFPNSSFILNDSTLFSDIFNELSFCPMQIYVDMIYWKLCPLIFFLSSRYWYCCELHIQSLFMCVMVHLMHQVAWARRGFGVPRLNISVST